MIRAVALVLLTSAATGAYAQQDGEAVSRVTNKTVVTLDGNYIYINAQGTNFQLTGPNGFAATSELPYFDFGGEVPDGIYTFTVYVNAGVNGDTVSGEENSEKGRQLSAVPGQMQKVTKSGSFKVLDNTISTIN